MSVLPQLTPGQTIAQDYTVVRPLAEGGMGAVYVVEQRSTGRQRALKVMHPQLVADARARERFAQEARVGAQIASEHIVEVLGAGVDERLGLPWLVMELLEGEDLASLVQRRGALPLSEASEVLTQAGEALASAHTAGVIHRDLKPENLFIATSKRRGVPFTLKVLDFGISRLVHEHRTAVTATSAIGSPIWMAPEQADQGQLRPATDVWALGLIAFHVLTGRYYWRSVNAGEVRLTAILKELLVEPLVAASARAAEYGREASLPAGFDAWFARCVAREPEARYRNGAEMAQGLAAVLAGTEAQPAIGRHDVAAGPSGPASTSGAGPIARTEAMPAFSSMGVAPSAHAPASTATPAVTGGMNQTPMVGVGGPGSTSNVPTRRGVAPWALAVIGGTVLSAAGLGLYLATNGSESHPPFAQQPPASEGAPTRVAPRGAATQSSDPAPPPVTRAGAQTTPILDPAGGTPAVAGPVAQPPIVTTDPAAATPRAGAPSEPAATTATTATTAATVPPVQTTRVTTAARAPGGDTAEPPARPSAEFAEGTSRSWNGAWSGGGYRYTFTLTLRRQGGNVDGQIRWRLASAADPSLASRVGDTAIESVRGTYDPASHALTFAGYRVSDSQLIGTDAYRLRIGADGGVSGASRTHAQDWSGRMSARPRS